jgi:hypothetical protein
MYGTQSAVINAPDLAAACRPFVKLLLTGGSGKPPEGRDAARPGAQVASNSERISVLADLDSGWNK